MICFTFAFGYDIILIICQISYWLLTCGNRWYNIFCYRNRWWMAPRPNIHCTHNNENNLDDRCYPWLVRSVSFVKKYLLIRILTKEFCQSLCILYNRLSWNTLKEQKKLPFISFEQELQTEKMLTISIIRCPQIAHFSDVCWNPEYCKIKRNSNQMVFIDILKFQCLFKKNVIF